MSKENPTTAEELRGQAGLVRSFDTHKSLLLTHNGVSFLNEYGDVMMTATDEGAVTIRDILNEWWPK